jgi:hypothetical protein
MAPPSSWPAPEPGDGAMPLTIDGFRRLTLSLPDVVEAAHMGHR